MVFTGSSPLRRQGPSAFAFDLYMQRLASELPVGGFRESLGKAKALGPCLRRGDGNLEI